MFAGPADLASSDGAAELGFDGAAEAVGAVDVLALQVAADGVGFFRCDGFHDEGAVGPKAFACARGECQVRVMRSDERLSGSDPGSACP